jgi:hypothetical protein
MQLRQDSRGNFYTDLIRVQDSILDRNQSRDDTSRAGTGIETMDGRVAAAARQEADLKERR